MNVSATSNEGVSLLSAGGGVRRLAGPPEPTVESGAALERPSVPAGQTRVDPERIARAAAAAEADFQRVKDLVKKSAPHTPYPPLESIDRLSSLLGKQMVSVVPLVD